MEMQRSKIMGRNKNRGLLPIYLLLLVSGTPCHRTNTAVTAFSVTGPTHPPRRIPDAGSPRPSNNDIARHPSALQQSQHENDNNSSLSSRRQRLKRWWKQTCRGVALFSLAWRGIIAPPPAQAKFSYELREEHTHSLRPGMSRSQAEQLQQGNLDVTELDGPSVFGKDEHDTLSSTQQKKGQHPKEKASDYLYLDDDETFLLEDDDVVRDVIGTQQDQQKSRSLQSARQASFASYDRQQKNAWLTAKVAVAIIGPTFGAQVVREHVRRLREERYVQKGLEIQRAQYAEYFNVTSAADDADVSDELKGLKNNNTTSTDDDEKDDGDDDDDDDDDNDDDTPPPSTSPRGGKKGPRQPKPDNDDNDGGSNNNDPGYGSPSDEDLDRLNRMFGKS